MIGNGLSNKRYIEDIYFFEVNTKYISWSVVKKICIFHECVARVKMLIFSPHEMKYILKDFRNAPVIYSLSLPHG